MKKNEKYYSHVEYRRAGVAHLLNHEKEIEFYYRNRAISLEMANEIVERHQSETRKKFNNDEIGEPTCMKEQSESS